MFNWLILWYKQLKFIYLHQNHNRLKLLGALFCLGVHLFGLLPRLGCIRNLRLDNDVEIARKMCNKAMDRLMPVFNIYLLLIIPGCIAISKVNKEENIVKFIAVYTDISNGWLCVKFVGLNNTLKHKKMLFKTKQYHNEIFITKYIHCR